LFKAKIVDEAYPQSQEEVDEMQARLRLPVSVIYDHNPRASQDDRMITSGSGGAEIAQLICPSRANHFEIGLLQGPRTQKCWMSGFRDEPD
jgi:RecJ-like exonuclease